MAKRAIYLLRSITVVRNQLADQTFVAPHAIRIQDGFAARAHADRLVEIIQRKSLGMQKTTLGFHDVFRHERFWSMAIVARGDSVMTRFLPAIVLIVHDMTVFARCRIIGQIRCTLAIPKRIPTGGYEQANENHERLFQGSVPLRSFVCRNIGPARQTYVRGPRLASWWSIVKENRFPRLRLSTTLNAR